LSAIPQDIQRNRHALAYSTPLSPHAWDRGMPIGNGRLGAMVMGSVGNEFLWLNEETIWAQRPGDGNNPDALEALPKVRQLLFEGKPQEAMQLASTHMMGSPNRVSPYQTLGVLHLNFLGERSDDVTGYLRVLDMSRGVATVRYRVGDVSFMREYFASAVDDVIVVRVSADRGGAIDLNLLIDRVCDATWQTALPNRLELIGRAGAYGTSFHCIADVQVEGGELDAARSGISIHGADSVVLRVACGSDFRGGSPATIATQHLAVACKKSYEKLEADHVADHRRLYDRVELQLADDEDGHAATPIDERLQAVKDGGEDAGLVEKLFHFGRYLLISCSRPGNLPANLQGIWCKDITPPWNCDFHININMQMNYWPAEVCNLSECHRPFLAFLRTLHRSGSETAKVHYGCRGWVAHHITNPQGFAAPGDGAQCGLWPTGGAWCATHLWEHFLYTRDVSFLSEHAWPIMRDAALFFLDFLVEDEQGRLLCGPSSSPENRYYLPDGRVGHLCMGPSMDSQIIAELFDGCLGAADVLGMDDAFIAELKAARAKLPASSIGKHGQLMEWPEDYDEPEPGHRHISHLFALHPGRQINRHTTPALAEACVKTLDRRLEHGGGHTGWSIAWMVNMFARLEDRERAYDAVLKMLRHSTLPSMLGTHPPYQIDGNFGGTAGIAELLLQSHADAIHLLPCLPDAWPNGSVRGLVARGGVVVDMTWRDGKLTEATLRCRFDEEVVVRMADEQRTVALQADVPFTL